MKPQTQDSTQSVLSTMPFLWRQIYVPIYIHKNKEQFERIFEDWRKGTTEDEMVGWHHRLSGHGFGWTPEVGDR